MSRIPGARKAFRFPWRTTRDLSRDVDAELAFHLARRVEELVAAGVPVDRARAEAERRFGNLEYTRRYCRAEDVRRERETRQTMRLDELKQDFQYALRSLRATPGFTLVALVTLALGVGANTAIFSVVRGVLLQPLPFVQSERIVRAWLADRAGSEPKARISEPGFEEWRNAATRLSSIAGYWYMPGGSGGNLTGSGTPERLEGAYITPEFFEVLGTPAAIGRTIRPDEAVRGNDRYMVLSDGLWRRRFGADPTIVGRPLTIGGEPHVVLGVMPAGFTFPGDRLDFWIPLSTIPEDDIGRGWGSRFLDVIGRLAPGATVEQARDELAAITRRIGERDPDEADWNSATVQPIRDALLGDVRAPLFLLLGAVAFVLLITCVNIASLLLARGTVRQRELAVRSALGAGRGRIVRQLVTESLTLSLAGGALGVALAYAGVRALAAAGAAELPRADSIRIDNAVLGYALIVSIGAGLLFGLLPALRSTAGNLQQALRSGARGMAGSGGQRLRSALVVAEVALAVVLVAGAALSAKSFARLLDVDPGFEPKGVLAVRIGMAYNDGDETGQDNRREYYTSVLERVAAVPGIQLVGAAKQFPLRGAGETVEQLIVPGATGDAGTRGVRVALMHVSTDYFRAMGVPLREGRTFAWSDDTTTAPVFMVNDAFARRYWPNESAVGKALRIEDETIEVIGVVGDIRQRSLSEPPEPTVYIHYLQNMRSGLSLALRTAGDPLQYAGAVRQAIWSMNRDQTITSVETMESIVGSTVARPRLLAALLVLFGTMGLVLGALGIYGVLAYAVSQRRQEIGVRVALGAKPRSVLGLIVGRGMLLAGVGIAAGLAGALALTRLMVATLYEVRPTDPQAFAVVIAVLLATALAASWLPARRALRIDPAQALRND